MTTPSSDPLGVGVTGVPPVVVQSPPSSTAETDTAGTVDTDTASAVDTVTTGTASPAPALLGGGHGDEITQPEVDKVTTVTTGPVPPFGDASDKIVQVNIVTAGTTSPAPVLGDGGGDQNAQAAQNGQASGTDHVMINTRRKRVTICEKTWVILGKYICCRCTTET